MTSPQAPAGPAELNFPQPLDFVDGLSAFQRLSLLRKSYLAQLRAGEGTLKAEERRLLLGHVERLLDVVETADLFVQECREMIEQVPASQLATQIQQKLDSAAASDAIKKALSGRDPAAVALEGVDAVRAMLADERQRLPQERASLQAGQRPQRDANIDDISVDAEFGAGATFVAAGAGIAVAVALAPVTVPAAVVTGGLFAGGFLVGFGGAMMVDALTS